MRSFVFALLAIIALPTAAQEQYTVDTVQTYFDKCAAEGKPIDAPRLNLTHNSMPGHVGRLNTQRHGPSIAMKVVQQIDEGTLVNVTQYYTTHRSPRPIVDTYGPFLFKDKELAKFPTEATFTLFGIWKVTEPFTYTTVGGSTRTTVVVEKLPDGAIGIPDRQPHNFLALYKARDWNKAGGEAIASGIYIGFEDGEVWIMRTDNEVIQERLAGLSSKDQAFVRKEIRLGHREFLIPAVKKEQEAAPNDPQ